MKKILLILTVCMFGFSSMAQDVGDEEQVTGEEKTDNDFLPSSGDIAFGLDGTPVFNFLSIIFTDADKSIPTNTLYGRYFLDNSSAVRARIDIESGSDVTSHYVDDDAAQMEDPLSRDQVVDKRTTTSSTYGISLGYQMFLNNNRLRSFVGGDLGYHHSVTSREFEYGNEMSELNPNPTTYFGPGDERTLEDFSGAENILSAGVFTGAEYYILPKMCVGTEVGVTYRANFSKQGYEVQETMVESQYVEEEIAASPSSTDWNLEASFPYSYFDGTVYFLIHF